MAEKSGMHHGMHHGAAFEGPRNTLPMMWGEGPYGPLEMGGMFTVVKIRDDIVRDKDPGWYKSPPDSVAKCISRNLDYLKMHSSSGNLLKNNKG